MLIHKYYGNENHLEIYLDYYLFPVVIKHNICPTLLVYFIQTILTASKAGLFTNLSTLLKQQEFPKDTIQHGRHFKLFK